MKKFEELPEELMEYCSEIADFKTIGICKDQNIIMFLPEENNSNVLQYTYNALKIYNEQYDIVEELVLNYLNKDI
jgi:hypothetical protein